MRLKPGRISYNERAGLLFALGKLAQEKYDEYVVTGGASRGYNLRKLRGALQFEIDVLNFKLFFYLAGRNKKWTDIANYFEYGTGLYNTNRAGRYRAGYIKPVIEEYMRFLSKKTGRWVTTGRVKGVRPVFAMEKAKAFLRQNRETLQRGIREQDPENWDEEF